MNKIVYDLLLKLEQCDDRHNRCDYLMEHDEITYLLEHIEEKDKEIERLNNIINNLDKMFEYYFLGNLKYDQDTVNTIYTKYIKLKALNILQGDDKNE